MNVVCSNLLRRVRVLSPAVSMALKGLKITLIESSFLSKKSTLYFLEFVYDNDYFISVIIHSFLIRARKFNLCLLCYVVLYCAVLCQIILCYAIMCYFILCYIIISYLILSYDIRAIDYCFNLFAVTNLKACALSQEDWQSFKLKQTNYYHLKTK